MKKKRLRQPGRPHQAYYISEDTRKGIFAKQNKRLRQPGRPHQAYTHTKSMKIDEEYRKCTKSYTSNLIAISS